MKNLILLLVFFFFFACKNPNDITKEEFDRKAWKSDASGCNGVRKKMVQNLEQIKTKLEGLDEIEVRQVLGSPDFAELYSRNQKFYTYYVDAAPKCREKNPKIKLNPEGRVVQIRFDAINAVNEVVIVRDERNKK